MKDAYGHYIKKGDFVKCIDNRGVSGILTLNHIYRVVQITGYIKIMDDTEKISGFFCDRFSVCADPHKFYNRRKLLK